MISREQMMEESGREIDPPAVVTKCGFDRAWIGPCNKPTVANENFCSEHFGKKCSCGNQAVEECSATIGPMVCGAYRCGGRCQHGH
jgi:hypothetical protein